MLIPGSAKGVNGWNHLYGTSDFFSVSLCGNSEVRRGTTIVYRDERDGNAAPYSALPQDAQPFSTFYFNYAVVYLFIISFISMRGCEETYRSALA